MSSGSSAPWHRLRFWSGAAHSAARGRPGSQTRSRLIFLEGATQACRPLQLRLPRSTSAKLHSTIGAAAEESPTSPNALTTCSRYSAQRAQRACLRRSIPVLTTVASQRPRQLVERLDGAWRMLNNTLAAGSTDVRRSGEPSRPPLDFRAKSADAGLVRKTQAFA